MTTTILRTPRRLGALLLAVAASLAVMSALHLGGVLAGGSDPFDPTRAGVAEATIAAVLVGGVLALSRGRRRAGLASTVFAVAGFVVGLSFTAVGGDAADVAYHAVVLPLLLIAAVTQLRGSRGAGGLRRRV